jgi:hypothetical protein
MNKRISKVKRKSISEVEYRDAFSGSKREKALNHALDIRKFEIDLYWKRATYFWTFIGASLAGYGAVQASSACACDKRALSVGVSCLGLVVSFGWYCANRGSKQWQENWENHVDMLEDGVTGPLYKTVLRRGRPRSGLRRCGKWLKELVNGPAQFSVSAINQIISLYISLLWVFLLIKARWPSSLVADQGYRVLIGITVSACLAFVGLGRTYSGPYDLEARRRESHVALPELDNRQMAQQEPDTRSHG